MGENTRPRTPRTHTNPHEPLRPTTSPKNKMKLSTMRNLWIPLAIIFCTLPAYACRPCEEENEKDNKHHRSSSDRLRDSFQEQLQKLQNEQQARIDAQTALTPDFWEMHRQGDDDKYRLLERNWNLRHNSVQLSTWPSAETVFPSKDEWARMKDDLHAIMPVKARRLRKKPSYAKGEL